MPKAGPLGPALFLYFVTGLEAFLLKGKEFRLTTDNEKEKGNWLLLKNHLFFTLSIIKFFYELCMKSFPTNYERFVTPSP